MQPLEIEPKEEGPVKVDELGPVKQSEEEKPKICCCYIWILVVMLGALTMGTGNFLYAVHFTQDGLFAIAYIAPLPFCLLVLWKSALAVRNKVTLGVYINLDKSNILDSKGEFKR